MDTTIGTATVTTLVELLRTQARRHGDRPAFLFCPDGDVEIARIGYRELDARARAIAATLQSHGAAGRRALVLCRPGIDAIAGIFGCLYGGAVAVPIDEQWASQRVDAIVPDADADFVVATAKSRDKMADRIAALTGSRNLHWCSLDPDATGLADPDTWVQPDIEPGTVAMLQYTSGTSGPPKGAVVTHRNLVHNLESIHYGWHPPADDAVFRSAVTGVSWLPNYHDMGLIGGVLGTLYGGRTTVLMAQGSFLMRPIRWLQAMSAHRAVITAAPNYAYDWCVKRSTPQQRAELDLSNWQVAVIGAEPIRAETLRAFTEAFAPSGFRPEAFRPAYGQVEATMGISGLSASAVPVIRHIDRAALKDDRVVPAEPGLPTTAEVVGCGPPRSADVVLVDPETRRRRTAGEVGEIWAAGPSVTGGYWNMPEATERVYRAHLADVAPRDTDAYRGPYLRTGDLGFIDGGELFITGRVSDLITVRGQNYYPADIENTAAGCHPALLPSRGAAFAIKPKRSLRSTLERLVIVQEIHRHHIDDVDLDALIETIRCAVSERHGLEPGAVALVKPMKIPTTSSGKVQRGRCKELFLANEFDPLAQWIAPLPTPEWEWNPRAEAVIGIARILRRRWERQNLPSDQL